MGDESAGPGTAAGSGDGDVSEEREVAELGEAGGIFSASAGKKPSEEAIRERAVFSEPSGHGFKQSDEKKGGGGAAQDARYGGTPGFHV